MYVLIPIFQLLRPFDEEIVALLRNDCRVIGMHLGRLKAEASHPAIVDLCGAFCTPDVLIIVDS